MLIIFYVASLLVAYGIDDFGFLFMGKTDNKNYCIYCGKQIAVDNIYCPNCGNKQDKQITEVSVDGNNSRIIRQIKNMFSSTRHIASEEYENYSFPWIWKNKVPKFIKKIIYITILIVIANIIALYNVIIYFVGFGWPDLIGMSIYLTIDILTVCYILYFYKILPISRKWYHKLIKAVSIFFLLVSLITTIIHIEFICENKYSGAKEKYIRMRILHSDDIKKKEKLLDEEYDSKYDICSYCPGKSEIGDTLQSMAYKGNATAQGILADVYFSTAATYINISKMSSNNNEDHFEEYYNRGFYWAKKAAEQGDKRGAFYLGQCYAGRYEELNISKNLDLACKYWEKSASKGYGKAYYKLGQLYGTWTLVNTILISASGKVYGGDLDDDYKTIIRTYPMPKNWRHDIQKARQYWNKALECGGIAAELAKESIEKVYMEEITEKDSIK